MAVSLGGGLVGGSPFMVQADPGTVCLAASAFEGAGLEQVRNMFQGLGSIPLTDFQEPRAAWFMNERVWRSTAFGACLSALCGLSLKSCLQPGVHCLNE